MIDAPVKAKNQHYCCKNVCPSHISSYFSIYFTKFACFRVGKYVLYIARIYKVYGGYMIIVVGGIKGGSGKTTLATNLAVLRSQHTKVLLVDADEQKSAWDWSQQRDSCETDLLRGTFSTVCMSGKTIYINLQRLQEDYDDIIVDTGGRDTTSQRAALCIADKLLLPFKPSSIDIWTLSPIKQILNECVNRRLKTFAVITQADPAGKDNQEAIDIIRQLEMIQALESTLGNRKAFRNAAAEGLGVCELFPEDKKASIEMEKLYESIYG